MREVGRLRVAKSPGVTYTDGNGTACPDGQTESGTSVGNAAHAPVCVTLPKAAICVQQVSGDLDGSASCLLPMEA